MGFYIFMEVFMKILLLYSIIFFSFFTCPSSKVDQVPLATSTSYTFPDETSRSSTFNNPETHSAQLLTTKARRLSDTLSQTIAPLQPEQISRNQDSLEDLSSRSRQHHRKSLAFSPQSSKAPDHTYPLKARAARLSRDLSEGFFTNPTTFDNPDSENQDYQTIPTQRLFAEHHDSKKSLNQDIQNDTNPTTENHFTLKIPKKYVEYSIVGIGAITWLFLQQKRPTTKRSIGIPTDAISVGYSVLSTVSSYASSGIAMVGAIYAWHKFSNFIHSNCKRNLKDQELKFINILDNYQADQSAKMQELGEIQKEIAEIIVTIAERIDEKNPSTQGNQTAAQAVEILKHTKNTDAKLKSQTFKVTTNKGCCSDGCSIQ